VTIGALLSANPCEGDMRSGGKRFWTGRELMILREYYPKEGLAGCVPRLPGRTASAIYGTANKQKLKSPITPAEKPKRYVSTAAIDEDIRRVYAAGATREALRRLSFLHSRPRRWITNRALSLGLSTPRFKEPRWSPAEDAILADNAHKHPKNLAKMMVKQGFHRTPCAIKVRIKRLGFCTEDPNHYTATGLGGLMGVDIKSVTAWIAKGWLKAKRRGTERVEAQGGDQWWISRQSVRAFIVDNTAAVNVGRCDKFWLVDLLAGQDA
jgi:hypothetical protein